MIAMAAGPLFLACNNTHQGHADSDGRTHEQMGTNYTCPMHPEVTGQQGDQCPECGMALVAGGAAVKTPHEVLLTTHPATIGPGKPVELTLAFKENGKDIPLEVVHEKKVHLLIVDAELSAFQHVHPVERADGAYTLPVTFPHGGRYYLFTDHRPQGGASTLDRKEVTVEGGTAPSTAEAAPRLVSMVDGYTLRLENGNDLRTGRTQPLSFSVAKDGKQLAERDIEPYLGATAHIAMINKQDMELLHIHPMSNDRYTIHAETRIDKPGRYRIWVEFQTEGTVHTADFTVDVREGDHAPSSDAHDHAGHKH